MRRIIVPRIPGVLAAAGLLAAPIEHEVSAAFLARLKPLTSSTCGPPSPARCSASELMRAERIAPADAIVLSGRHLFHRPVVRLEIPFDPESVSWQNDCTRIFLSRMNAYTAMPSAFPQRSWEFERSTRRVAAKPSKKCGWRRPQSPPILGRAKFGWLDTLMRSRLASLRATQ